MPVDHVGLFFHRFQRHQENDPEPAAAPRPRLQSPEEVAAKKRAEEASAKAGSLGLLGVFEQANVKDVAAEAIARAVAWCDEQMVGSVDDIKGEEPRLTHSALNSSAVSRAQPPLTAAGMPCVAPLYRGPSPH